MAAAAMAPNKKPFVFNSDVSALPKDTDWIIDMSLQGPWKRPLYSMPGSSRHVKKPKETLRCCDGDDDPVGDEDYKEFLRVLELKYGKEEQEANEFDYADPQYKIFMANLRADGTSYVLEISRENGLAVRIKYELEDNRPCGGNGKNSETQIEEERRDSETPREKEEEMRKSETPREKEEGMRKSETPREKEEGMRNSETQREKEEDRRKSATPREQEEKEDSRNIAVKIEDKPKASKVEKKSYPINCVSRGTDGGSSVTVKSESYQVFMNRGKLDNIAASVLAKRGEKRLKREDDDEKTLPETKKLASHSAKRIIGTEGVSQFREKLMGILRMPYDQKEYQELWHEINDRKPATSHRDLRGRIKIYELGHPGKSYLDHQADLAKKIDLVCHDCPKVLNLLRGFFYWLRNLSHQGSFRPWLDSSCLMVVPKDASRLDSDIINR